VLPVRLVLLLVLESDDYQVTSTFDLILSHFILSNSPYLNVQCDLQRDERAHAAPHEGQPDLVLLLQPLTRAYKGLRHVIALVLSESILSDRQETSHI
jgi:hypothetical protein